MPANGPNEWDDLRRWVAARIARPIDLTAFADHDRARLTRSRAALASALDEPLAAADAIRAELSRSDAARAEPDRAERSFAEPAPAVPGRAGPARAESGRAEPAQAEPARAEPGRAEPAHETSLRADDLLRVHLSLALAARTTHIRDVTPGGALVITGRAQLAECRALADEILTTAPDPELVAFATDLRHRVARGERWRWVAPRSAVGFGVVALAVLVLPFVGGAVDDPLVTAAGVLLGGAFVFASVVAHRKQQWAVDAETASARPQP
ncbi:hypothetical protein [Saccharothrix hoggarensis]